MSEQCVLCARNGRVLWSGRDFYVIDAQEKDIPGYTRIIASRHVAEMSDLAESERQAVWRALHIAETVMRRCTGCHKVNLAEFGNMVPHMHWHVIPRWRDDPWFPGSTWSQRVRDADAAAAGARAALAARYFEELAAALDEAFGPA